MCLSLRHRWRAVRSRPAQEVNAGPPATQTWRRCACLTCSSAPLVPAVAGDRASGHALHRGHALALVEQLLKLNRGAGRITWGAPPRSAMRGQRALGGQRRVRQQDGLPRRLLPPRVPVAAPRWRRRRRLRRALATPPGAPAAAPCGRQTAAPGRCFSAVLAPRCGVHAARRPRLLVLCASECSQRRITPRTNAQNTRCVTHAQACAPGRRPGSLLVFAPAAAHRALSFPCFGPSGRSRTKAGGLDGAG